MRGRILIAGAGHGGLAAGAALAKAGFDVVLYEKKARKELGWDWEDVIDLAALEESGVPPLSSMRFEPSHHICYTNPKKTVYLRTPKTKPLINVRVERKYLLEHLIEYALKCGVDIRFGEEAVCPIVSDGAVRGLVTRRKDKLQAREGDLVIDAAGMDSPVRQALPAEAGVTARISDADVIFCWRGYFDKLPGEEPPHEYTVHFFHTGRPGLDWVVSLPDAVDIFVGKFASPLTQAEVDEALADFRADYPILGPKLIRGGQFARIPVRKTLSTLVWNGYALVGDSAAMTIPLLGSGLNNTLLASKMLAETVIAADGDYSVAKLWPYQYEYFEKIGAKMAMVDELRELAMNFTAQEVDYLLEREILSEKEFGMGSSRSVPVEPSQVMAKVAKMLAKPRLISGSGKALVSIGRSRYRNNRIPKEYDPAAVAAWREKYDAI